MRRPGLRRRAQRPGATTAGATTGRTTAGGYDGSHDGGGYDGVHDAAPARRAGAGDRLRSRGRRANNVTIIIFMSFNSMQFNNRSCLSAEVSPRRTGGEPQMSCDPRLTRPPRAPRKPASDVEPVAREVPGTMPTTVPTTSPTTSPANVQCLRLRRFVIDKYFSSL